MSFLTQEMESAGYPVQLSGDKRRERPEDESEAPLAFPLGVTGTQMQHAMSGALAGMAAVDAYNETVEELEAISYGYKPGEASTCSPKGKVEGQNWCVTWWLPFKGTLDEDGFCRGLLDALQSVVDKFSALPDCRGGAQLELSSKNKERYALGSPFQVHVQMWVSFRENKVLGDKGKSTGVHQFLPHGSWRKMRGSINHNKAYCSKESDRLPGTEYVTWGPLVKPGDDRVPPQHRLLTDAVTDPSEPVNAAVSAARAVKKQRPEGVMMRMSAAIEELWTKWKFTPGGSDKVLKGLLQDVEFRAAFLRNSQNTLQTIKAMEPKWTPPPPGPMRSWQRGLYNYLMSKPDDRTIVWICDPVGNAGKSRFMQMYLALQQDALCAPSSLNEKDFALAFNNHRVVFFDITREKGLAMKDIKDVWSIAENLKSGAMFSAKYNSTDKVFPPPHVVFFSNGWPEPGKWSVDRIYAYHIDNVQCKSNRLHKPGDVCYSCSGDMMPVADTMSSALPLKHILKVQFALGGGVTTEEDEYPDLEMIPYTSSDVNPPVGAYIAHGGCGGAAGGVAGGAGAVLPTSVPSAVFPASASSLPESSIEL